MQRMKYLALRYNLHPVRLLGELNFLGHNK